MVAPESDPDVRFRFGHDRSAARLARRHIDALFTDRDDTIADDVRLAASEMVSNVVVHTQGGGELRAWDPRPQVPLRVEVEDGDSTPPAIPERRPDIGGRGLAIVAAVADDWGYETQPDGKVVWAEFDRDKRRRPNGVE